MSRFLNHNLLLVSAGMAPGRSMGFLFKSFELLAVALSVACVSLMSLAGETRWLEGQQLLAAYFIVAVAFLFGQV